MTLVMASCSVVFDCGIWCILITLLAVLWIVYSSKNRWLRVNLMALPLYKIGITSKSVKERFFRSDFDNITVLHTEPFDIGSDARDYEQDILIAFREHQYTGPKILASNVNTELFTKDVLGLDTTT